MSVEFVKMLHFTRLLKTEGRLREYNFRKLGGPKGEEFSVDTVDERGNRIMFTMKKESDHWRINSTPLPGWVRNCEPELHGVIEEELGHQF